MTALILSSEIIKRKILCRSCDDMLRRREEKEPQVELIDIAHTQEYENLHLSQTGRAYQSIYQRYRTDATSSVLTVLSRMPEDGCRSRANGRRGCGSAHSWRQMGIRKSC